MTGFPLQRWQRGFTLLEILTVVAIITVLAVFAFPAIESTQRAFNISRAGALLRDQLLLARQLAISDNVSVFACLFESAGSVGPTTSVNGVVLARSGTNGVFQPIARPVRFPEGIVVSKDPQWSSLNQLTSGNVRIGSTQSSCSLVGYKPTGTTSLSSSQEWFLTVCNEATFSKSQSNFVTLAIEPVTGRIVSYQP